MGKVFGKLKDLRVILVILLIISWVAAGLVLYTTKTKSDAQIEQLNNEVVDLNMQLDMVGELVPAYTVREDVPAGKKIDEADLELIEVPVGVSGNLVQDLTTLTNMYYKLNLTAGSPLTNDCIYEEQLTDDLRYFDLVTSMNPIGLEPGSYVDIRITMPMGEDYIAISHRKVEQINSGILKLVLNEKDIHTYNSMLVDSIIYPGAQIYAVEYVEGGIQAAAETYYPMSTVVVALAEKDPNLLSAIRADMLQRRGILEESMTAAGVNLTEKQIEELGKTIEKGRDNIVKSMSESQKQVDKERAEFEKAQAAEQGGSKPSNSAGTIGG